MANDDLGLYGSPAEQLKVVNEAIYSILKGGQRYKIGTRELQRADLKQLYEMQRQLQGAVGGDDRSSLFTDCVVGVFDRR